MISGKIKINGIQKKFDTVWAITIVLIAIGIIGTGLAMVSDYGLDTGRGEQIGIISEVESSGIIWKPPEIRLISIMPTFSTKDTVYYFAGDDEFMQLATGYMRTQTPVIISYEMKYITFSWDYSSRVIITDIQPYEA